MNTQRQRRRHHLNPQSSFLIALCVVMLGLLIGLLDSGQAQDAKNPYTGNKEAIAEGEKLYKMLNCYGCHGMRGGGGMGPSLSDEEWKTGDGSDTNLLAQIREGRGTMPAFKDAIEDDQAWKIIAFVRTLYKGDPAKAKW